MAADADAGDIGQDDCLESNSAERTLAAGEARGRPIQKGWVAID